MTTPATGKPAIERDEGRTRRLARRGLLRALAAGGAGAVLGAKAAAGAASGDRPADAAGAEDDHRRLGFQPTDHTRWFYHRARW